MDQRGGRPIAGPSLGDDVDARAFVHVHVGAIGLHRSIAEREPVERVRVIRIDLHRHDVGFHSRDVIQRVVIGGAAFGKSVFYSPRSILSRQEVRAAPHR
jgi:hypothetical protein